MEYKLKKMMRSAKNNLYSYNEVEVRVREATSNDEWLPSTTQMGLIAEDTEVKYNYKFVMNALMRRLTDYDHKQHVAKSLYLIIYLVKNGSEQCVQDMKTRQNLIKRLTGYKYYRDDVECAADVRERAEELYSLLTDDDVLEKEREKAKAITDKITGVSNKTVTKSKRKESDNTINSKNARSGSKTKSPKKSMSSGDEDEASKSKSKSGSEQDEESPQDQDEEEEEEEEVESPKPKSKKKGDSEESTESTSKKQKKKAKKSPGSSNKPTKSKVKAPDSNNSVASGNEVMVDENDEFFNDDFDFGDGDKAEEDDGAKGNFKFDDGFDVEEEPAPKEKAKAKDNKSGKAKGALDFDDLLNEKPKAKQGDDVFGDIFDNLSKAKKDPPASNPKKDKGAAKNVLQDDIFDFAASPAKAKGSDASKQKQSKKSDVDLFAEPPAKKVAPAADDDLLW